MKEPLSGHVDQAGRCPRIGAGIVPPAGLKAYTVVFTAVTLSAPNDHFAASPDCRVPETAIGRSRRGCGRPTVGDGIVSAAGVEIVGAAVATPHNHFAAGPYCGMFGPAFGGVV